MPTVGTSKFFRHTLDRLPGFLDTFGDVVWETLLKSIIKTNWSLAKKGYRDGVILIPISPKGLKCRTVTLQPEQVLTGSFSSRVEGEAPRKRMGIDFFEDMLPEAKFAKVVLYRADVLAEDNDRTTEADWEIITLLTSMVEDEPMEPETLMANHFGADGGTSTKMSAIEFEAALRKSYDYWKDKCLWSEEEKC